MPAQRTACALIVVSGLMLSACGTPVRVRRVDPDEVHRALTSNVLSTGEISQHTLNVLFSYNLRELFDEEPAAALTALHAIAFGDGGRRRDVFALAELSFLHAEEARDPSYFLAAAIYAYAFLFPSDPERIPSPYDPRLRIACDLYNRSIVSAFATSDGEVRLQSARYRLPFGQLDVTFDANSLIVGDRRLVRFVPLADLQVTGLETRYRGPGIGAPLAASTEPRAADLGYDDFIQPWAKVGRSALLRFEGIEAQIRSGELHADLELVAPTSSPSVTIGSQTAPVEVESSASLAYTLSESPVWAQEIKGFLEGVGVIDEKSRLAALMPHRPGRIPVVLVHGTASSSGRWAQMLNELINDSRIVTHYEFWLFTYNTGNPILHSSLQLRRSLERAAQRLDPKGEDPAMRRMVVIGHSQGGLLAKMTAIDSGPAFFATVSRLPLDQLVLAQKERDLISEMMFVTPVPDVRRVIFLATPQHGSYFAGNFLSHWVARFITLPADLVNLTTDLVLHNQQALAFAAIGETPTAVANMTPGNPFIQALADMPIAPGVKANSIIAVEGDGALADEGDGIVAYSSAHLDGVESELVVRSGHSCQDNPLVIREVRRILLEHLRAL